MKKEKEVFIVKEGDAIEKVNVKKKYNIREFVIFCAIIIAILFFVFGRDFRKELPPEMIHKPIQKEAPMIIGTLRKGDQLDFSGKVLTVLYVSTKKDTVNCTLRDENLNQASTKTFSRVGDDIKSGIDIGNCQKYIPAKKIIAVGQKYGDIIIRKILRKNKEGWICLVSYGSAFSRFLKTIHA